MKFFNWFWKRKITVVVVMALIMGGYYGYRYFFIKEEKTRQIKTAIVERGDIKIIVTGSGQVYAKNQVDLKPQVAGDGLDVVEVKVKNDQEVKRDDIIAILDSTDAQEKIQSSQLQLKSAQLKMKQTEEQYNTKTYDDKLARQMQENALAQQRIELNNAYKDLEDYTIKAPFDGIVTGLSVEVGDSISRDEILASIITKELYAEITLNEVDAVKVTQGKKVQLTFDALDSETMTGEVSKIETIGTVEQGVVSYVVEISFENSSQYLKPGMSVNAEIEIENKKNVLRIPNGAIKESDDKKFVMVANSSFTSNFLSENRGNDKQSLEENFNSENINQNQSSLSNRSFKRKEIEIGISDDIYTEVVNGLSEGEEIIVSQTTVTINSDNNSKNTNSLIPGGSMGGRGMRMR